jgi:hypothetical protein
MATCPVCKRPKGEPWPLDRGPRCSPKDWVLCIRPWEPEKATSLKKYRKIAARIDAGQGAVED